MGLLSDIAKTVAKSKKKKYIEVSVKTKNTSLHKTTAVKKPVATTEETVLVTKKKKDDALYVKHVASGGVVSIAELQSAYLTETKDMLRKVGKPVIPAEIEKYCNEHPIGKWLEDLFNEGVFAKITREEYDEIVSRNNFYHIYGVVKAHFNQPTVNYRDGYYYLDFPSSSVAMLENAEKLYRLFDLIGVEYYKITPQYNAPFTVPLTFASDQQANEAIAYINRYIDNGYKVTQQNLAGDSAM